MGALRTAGGVLLTLTAAVGYVHGIAFLQDWQTDRMEAQAQEVVDTFIEPAEDTLGDLTTDKVAPPAPATDLVCGENETANEDLTACVPLEPSQEGSVDVSVVIEPLPEEGPPATGGVPVLAGWEDGQCYEDEPCWVCETMGNGECGEGWVYEEPPAEPGSDWNGLLVGDVIVCPPGFEVSVDTTPAGTTWAACM